MRSTRYLATAPLFVVGALLTVYGIFALTFREGGGNTTVSLLGHEIDAHLAGSVSLVLALIVIGGGIVVMRRWPNSRI